MRDLGQDAWLPRPCGQQYSHFSLVDAIYYQQDDISRNRVSRRLPFDWLLSATVGALSLRRAVTRFGRLALARTVHYLTAPAAALWLQAIKGEAYRFFGGGGESTHF